MTRLTRAEKKTETRARLLDAAEVVFARDGYHAASVDDVCEEAGFSKGALYSNFDSKEDLLMTLVQTQMEEHIRLLAERMGSGGTLEQRVRDVAAFLDEQVGENRTWCVLYMEFWTHAMRTPDLRPRVAEMYESWRRLTAELIEAQAREMGLGLPLPADQLAAGVVGLFDGFLLQKLVDPERFSSDDFADILMVFLAGMAALSGGALAGATPHAREG